MEEERILKLENRVNELESELKRIREVIERPSIDMLKHKSTVSQIDAPVDICVEYPSGYRSTRSSATQSKVSAEKKSKAHAKPLFNEAVIGKYLIGGLTSLLVFAAIIYLVTVFWNSMSNEAKFGLIMLGSLGLLATGYIRINKHRDVVTSLLMGIGAGSSFIGLAAGHVALGILSQITTIILITVWGSALMLSFKYTKMFFLAIIAYIGSVFAIVFMLITLTSNEELLVAVLFSVVIASIFIVSAKTYMTLLFQRVTYLLLFATPVLMTCFVWDFYPYTELISKNVITGVLLVLSCLMFILTGLYCHSIKDEEYSLKSAFLEIMVALSYLSLHAVLELPNRAVIMGMSQSMRLFVVVLFESILFAFLAKYSLMSLLTFAWTVLGFFSVKGLGLHGLSFLALASYFLLCIPINRQRIVSVGLTSLSGLFILLNRHSFLDITTGSALVFILESAVVITLIALLLTEDKSKYTFGYFRPMSKILLGLTFVAVLIAVSISLVSPAYPWGDLRIAVGFLSLSIGLTLCLMSGVWSEWDTEDFRWFGRNNLRRLDVSGKVMSFLLTLPYLFGMLFVLFARDWYEHLPLILGLIIIACMQSAIIYIRFRNHLALIWSCVKFLLLTWTILWTVTGINVMHIVASLVAIALAFLAVFIGSRFNLKSLRLFGLVLTPVMVLKMLLSDLNGSNGMAYVIALLVGAGLCFLIVLIYQRSGSSIDYHEDRVDSKVEL